MARAAAVDLRSATVVVLKEKPAWVLRVSGRKAELVDRLLEADARVLEGGV